MDNKLKILNHLGKNIGERYTMHELSQKLEIPYATFYRKIQEMKDLLEIRKVGKAKTITLNLENAAARSHLAVSSHEEKKEYLETHRVIKKITSEIDTDDIVLLFGSYAKGTQTEKSDIDLLIINKSGEKTLLFSKYETLFKKEINPMFITEEEFKEMLQEKEENVGKQALKNHIVLNNPERFWELTINGVQ